MDSKKDFSKLKAGRVYTGMETAISARGQQGTASPEEQSERAAEMRTQGRKGCKAVRINMAFTPDNHEFIKVMAKVTGKSMAEYLNLIVQRYREEHPEKFEQAKGFINDLEK